MSADHALCVTRVSVCLVRSTSKTVFELYFQRYLYDKQPRKREISSLWCIGKHGSTHHKKSGVPYACSTFCPVMQPTRPACTLSAHLHYLWDPGARATDSHLPMSTLLAVMVSNKVPVSNPGVLGLLLTFVTLVFSDPRILLLTLDGLTCQHTSLVKPYAPQVLKALSWKCYFNIIVIQEYSLEWL